MKKLTDFQKGFILDTFFNNEKPNWRTIATELIEQGSCVVGGEELFWFGGIGNHIEHSSNPKYIGCLEYKFNIDNFLSSEYFQGTVKSYIFDFIPKKVTTQMDILKAGFRSLEELKELADESILKRQRVVYKKIGYIIDFSWKPEPELSFLNFEVSSDGKNIVMEGYIKWDGCINFQTGFGYVHFCNKEETKTFNTLFDKIYEKAKGLGFEID